MDCKTTSTKRRTAGTTLVEMLIAVGISGMVFTGVAQITFFSGRSLAALFNYCDLDAASRSALDRMSKEARQANALTAWTDTSLTFNDFDNTPLTYSWGSNTKTLVRTKGGVSQTLLKECDTLKFSVYQRNPMGGTYDQYPVATPGTAKLVQVSWICSRKILGNKVNTESVQSAKFVIRKQ